MSLKSLGILFQIFLGGVLVAQLRPGVHSKYNTLAKWAKTYFGKWPARAHWVYWEEGHWVGSAQTTKGATHHTPWVKGRLSGSCENTPGIFWLQKSSQKEGSPSAQSKACSDSLQAPRSTLSRMIDGTMYISIRGKPISQKGDHMEASISAPPSVHSTQFRAAVQSNRVAPTSAAPSPPLIRASKNSFQPGSSCYIQYFFLTYVLSILPRLNTSSTF